MKNTADGLSIDIQNFYFIYPLLPAILSWASKKGLPVKIRFFAENKDDLGKINAVHELCCEYGTDYELEISISASAA